MNIAHRVAYAETGATGQGVTKTRDKKAGAEMVAVWDYEGGGHSDRSHLARRYGRLTSPLN